MKKQRVFSNYHKYTRIQNNQNKHTYTTEEGSEIDVPV
jgi:hypothetical protein